MAERVAIDVGRPGSVKVGVIQLRSVYTREMEDYREQMMRMLRGLLPDLPPESIAGVARSGKRHSSNDFDLHSSTALQPIVSWSV